MSKLFYFEDLCNGTTIISDGEKRRTFEIKVDTERLHDTLDKKQELSKLALKLYKADYRDISSYSPDRDRVFKKMREKVLEALKELHPDTWRPEEDHMYSRAFDYSYSNNRASAVHYVFVMALEYLGLLDEFLEENDEYLKKMYKRQKEFLRDKQNAWEEHWKQL